MRLLAFVLMLLLAACGRDEGVAFHPDENPEKLSDWGILQMSGERVRPAPDSFAYTLQTPLFTDYAGKLRTVWIPKGKRATYTASGPLDFPVGTIISKTFFYRKSASGLGRGDRYFTPTSAAELDLRGVRMMETRLLVRRTSGWVGLPYVWNAEQTEATLQRTGAIEDITLDDIAATPVKLTYQVPNANQCAQCHETNHTTKVMQPIGLTAAHLNHIGFGGAPAQLQRLVSLRMLDQAPADAPRSVNWRDASASVDARARSYLDINCAHCHNSKGAADTSGLSLEPGVTDAALWGVCKTPVAAGQGSGDRLYDIVPGKPDASILLYRMESTDPAKMMPELGRSVADREGVALIRQWIREMPGGCAAG